MDVCSQECSGAHLRSCGVVEDASHVVLKGRCHGNGAGYGSVCIDLGHHVLLPLYLPMLGDVVLPVGGENKRQMG